MTLLMGLAATVAELSVSAIKEWVGVASTRKTKNTVGEAQTIAHVALQ
jgi:hypothetical protein